MKKRSLALELLLWILPMTATATAGISAATYLVARSVILRQLEQGIQAITRLAGAEAGGFFRQGQDDIVTVAQSPLLRDYFLNKEYGLTEEASMVRREIAAMLRDLALRTRRYPDLLYLDASGRAVCRVRNGAVAEAGPSASERDFFASLRALKPREVRASRLEAAPGRSAPFVLYGTGVFDQKARLRGVLIFSASLRQVYADFERLRLDNPVQISLADRRAGASSRSAGKEGEDLLRAYGPIAGTPWAVLTKADSGEFLKSLDLVNTATASITVLAGLLISLLLAKRVRTLLRPIAGLASAAESYSRGELGVRADASGPREVSALADSLNLMAERLERRTGELLQRLGELGALQALSDAALRTPDREAVGRACLEAAAKGLGRKRGVLYWVDEKRNEITAGSGYGLEAVGLSQTELRQHRVPIEEPGIYAEVVRRRTPMVVADASSDPRGDMEFAARIGGKCFCAAPIIARQEVVAIICLDWDPSEAGAPGKKGRSLGLFCSAAGLALESSRLMEEMLRSEARYRTAVENSPHAVVGLDQNFRIALWNRRAEALFGYQPDEARGHTLALVLGEEAGARLRRKVETEGAVRDAEFPGRGRDGRAMDLAVSCTGQSARGGAGEWFVTIQDVTEKKSLQGQIIQAEKLSAVGTLLAGIAHELNNPLAVVVGFAEILMNDLALRPKDVPDLRCLHDNALRCRDVVQGLLLFSRNAPVAKQRISLNHVVQSALALFEYRLAKVEGIHLDVNLDPALPLFGGEFQKIQQVAVNLLANACDALKGRPEPRSISVRTRVKAQGAEFEVEDSGPGVPPEDRERIFEPFHTTKMAGEGTGLGLSISRQIVSEIGGTISCAEGRGGGARFVVSLPPCPAEAAEPESRAELPSVVPGRRVLLVDDEPTLLALMARLLSGEGLKVETAPGSKEALGRILRGRFDLVVTDVSMGTFNAARIVDLIREMHPRERPAVVIVTGNVLDRTLGRQLSDLRVPILAKPFLRVDFLRAVRRALASKDFWAREGMA